MRNAASVLLLLGLVHPGLIQAQAGKTYKPGFSTFYGGSGMEWARDIATDAEGNLYVTGGTTSRDLPTTAGAYQRELGTGGTSLGSGGVCDIFVAKYNPSGRLIWSTYLGGPNYDRAYAIEIDNRGYIYLAGRAGDGFPTTSGVVQEKFAGDEKPLGAYGKQDGFIAKLSPDGSRLLWATYLGEAAGGIIRDIDINPATGEVYAVLPGVARPFNHITSDAFQTKLQGGNDMAVVKLSPDAKKIIYGTYLGGSGNDGGGPTVRVDAAGSAYVTGSTSSPNIPTTAGAHSRKLSGKTDLYLAKLTPDGTGLVFGSYLGGSGLSASGGCHNLALNRQGNVFVSGYTKGPGLPTTPGAVRRKFMPNSVGVDMFIAKFSPTGALLASTYIDGSGEGLAADPQGNVYTTGNTASKSFPASPDAVQKMLRGAEDAALVKLSPDLSKVLYATYMGGAEGVNVPDSPECRHYAAWRKSLPNPWPEEAFRGIAIDSRGNILVAGATDSFDWPTLSPHQPKHGGCGSDVTVVRLIAAGQQGTY